MSRLFRFLSATLFTIVNFSLIPSPAYAQVAEATTTIDGLTCPFCSFGAKKRLKTVDGVDKVTVDVMKGIATLQANPGESINVQQISGAVKKAGFAPGVVRIVAIGRVQKNGENLHLHLSDQEERLLLDTIDQVQQEKLRSIAEQGLEIEVTGLWSIAEAEPYARITPESVREL